MIGKKIQDALNAQITLEQYSAQLYLAMGAHCEGRSFRGFAHWLRVQAQEETKHALKLVDFPARPRRQAGACIHQCAASLISGP
jgi:ferritin